MTQTVQTQIQWPKKGQESVEEKGSFPLQEQADQQIDHINVPGNSNPFIPQTC